MELLWQNGPIVMHSPDTGEEMAFPADKVIGFDGEIPEILYTEEDGMIQIPPLDYHLLYSVHPSSPTRLTTQMNSPPPLPWPEAPGDASWMQNFLSPPESPSQLPEKESSEAPMVREPDGARISGGVAESSVQLNEASAGVVPLEHTGMTVPEGPRTSGETQPKPPSVVVVEDTKQKGILENDHSHSHNEDIYLEAAAAKKHCSGSKSAKRSRAAEVHNLSERRRRDRINEKMRTLKDLLPHCTKPDKASFLDEVIEHLKSLKMQAQKLSMGWSVVYPNMEQYVRPMGMGMNRPMVPYRPMMGPQVPRPLPQMQNYVDMSPQLLNRQQLSKNRVLPQTNPNKPSTSRNPGNLENHGQQFG